MERSLEAKVMSPPVYIAIAFVLWSVTTSVLSLGASAATVWTWLLVAGGVVLLSLSALRVATANELGVYAREVSPEEALSGADTLARRVGHLDTWLLVLIILWMFPLVAAMFAGVLEH